MKTLLKNLEIAGIANGKRDLLLSEGYIRKSRPAGQCDFGKVDFAMDCSEFVAIPGIIDTHTHGSVGVDANHINEADLSLLSAFFASQGVTSFFLSILSEDPAIMETLLPLYADCIERGGLHGARLSGIHLEGPWLAPSRKGAMPEAYLKESNLELFLHYQELARGHIKYMTVAPEIEDGLDLIELASNHGVVVGVGHSDADYDTAREAFARGARVATHLCNAMRPIDHHEPGILGAVLESDLYCETILDGRHLHPGMVRLIDKTVGRDRIVAITDAIMAAGLKDGNYILGANEVVVKDGDARLAQGNARAGSTLVSSAGLRNAMRFLDTDVAGVVPIFCENPARLYGLNDRGKILPGMLADIVLLDSDMNIAHTFVGGRRVFGELS